MSQQNSVEIEALPLREIAKGWEGQLANGEFYLRHYLGGSDHSAVFLTAYDEQDPQPAAIKFISADSTGAEIQFSRWELATKLSHPNLLRIFQIGRCELRGVNLLYAVMEYAEEDLSQILPQRALTPDEARGMLAATLEALAYIHDEGLLHGHLCSSNIMASGDQLKLSIGLPCPIGELPAMPNPRPFAEARTGLSPADDVWTLGMLLVEACTQNPPTWDARSSGPVVPQTLPAPFFDIARNCLRKDPLRRWTISDIVLGLQALPKPESHETRVQKVLDGADAGAGIQIREHAHDHIDFGYRTYSGVTHRGAQTFQARARIAAKHFVFEGRRIFIRNNNYPRSGGGDPSHKFYRCDENKFGRRRRVFYRPTTNFSCRDPYSAHR